MPTTGSLEDPEGSAEIPGGLAKIPGGFVKIPAAPSPVPPHAFYTLLTPCRPPPRSRRAGRAHAHTPALLPGYNPASRDPKQPDLCKRGLPHVWVGGIQHFSPHPDSLESALHAELWRAHLSKEVTLRTQEAGVYRSKDEFFLPQHKIGRFMSKPGHLLMFYCFRQMLLAESTAASERLSARAPARCTGPRRSPAPCTLVQETQFPQDHGGRAF